MRSRIDVERYPKNYEAIVDELERRRRVGNLHGSNTDHLAWPEDDDDDDEFFFEFSAVGHKKRRRFFIGIFLLFNVIILGTVVPKYFVKSLNSTHQYNTSLTAFKCNRNEVEETGSIRVYHDLDIISGDDLFVAFDISPRMCLALMSDYKMGDEISIWHHQGIVYQLKVGERVLVSYRYLKSRIRDVQTEDVFMYWAILILVWFVLFKSVINAISPGSFVKD